MSATAEVQGVVLAFVTRIVTGELTRTRSHYDEKKMELVHEEIALEDPVIVFFPNGTSQVFAEKEAALKGFLQSPEILNFSSVEDKKTPAGKFKFAIRESDRQQAWLDMEDNVIRRVIGKSGYPLPDGVVFEKTSLLFNTNER